MKIEINVENEEKTICGKKFKTGDKICVVEGGSFTHGVFVGTYPKSTDCGGYTIDDTIIRIYVPEKQEITEKSVMLSTVIKKDEPTDWIDFKRMEVPINKRMMLYSVCLNRMKILLIGKIKNRDADVDIESVLSSDIENPEKYLNDNKKYFDTDYMKDKKFVAYSIIPESNYTDKMYKLINELKRDYI